jgi:signal transduction histidine kinase/HAMP domain-containing protein
MLKRPHARRQFPGVIGASLGPVQPTEPAATPDSPETRSQRLHRRQRRSLLRQAFGTKLLTTFAVIMTLVTMVVFTLAAAVVNDTANRVLEQRLAERLRSVAALAAIQLAKPYTISQADQSTNPQVREQAVRRLESIALRIKEGASVREVVLFSGEDPAFRILASSSGKGAYEGALGRLLADALYIERARADAMPTDSSLYPLTDFEGELHIYKSGYAPVLDSSGKILAMIAVEVPANFKDTMARVNNSFMALAGLAGLSVLVAAVFLVRQRVHLPVYRLVKAMQGVDGSPSQARIRHRDEIGILTEHYNDMVDRLLEKDAELRELYAQARETAAYLKGYSNHLVGGVPSGVVAVDPHGLLTVWNESASRILRQSHEVGEIGASEAVGKEHPLARALRNALAGSVTDQALVVLGDPGRDEDGEDAQRLVELSCAPFRDEEGELLGAVAVVTDRTELERFRQVAVRNERLAAIGNLGAGLAHEIKNPLGAISGFAELIERRADESLGRLTKRLRGEILELNSFLNEFLLFTREQTIRREPADVNELVERSVELGVQGLSDVDPEELVRWREAGKVSLSEGKELHLRLDLDDVLPEMAIDATLLRSACANLVRNALEVMRSTGGELSVRTHRVGEQVFLRFRDTGPGVPLELREKIFNPLFTTRAEGTGLGLAIANKTVTAHRGKLSLRDAPGGGAEFVIRLPIVAVAGA